MHALAFMILFLGAIVVTAVIFVVWVIITVIRGITRLIIGPGMKPRATAAALPRSGEAYSRRCPRDSCNAMNAAEARFCRRCGEQFLDARHVPARRVAML